MPLEAVQSRRWGKAHWSLWEALEEQNVDDIKMFSLSKHPLQRQCQFKVCVGWGGCHYAYKLKR